MTLTTPPTKTPRSGDAQAPASPVSAIAYRPDIDGLRAVAVIAVVLFHAKYSAFSGGFVGVDVFFVISGFLITSIIARKLEAGAFSLVEFYERRVRRILPAMLAMAAFVTAFTLLFKTPSEADRFGESLSFFGLLASNHFFLQERGYFDVPREESALLHTWSLAVEEQFYLVFPLLLLALSLYAPKRTRIVLLTLAVASYLTATWNVSAAAGSEELSSDLAFFFAPLRAWELLLGAFLALGYAPAALTANAPRREAIAWIGAALILGPIFFYDAATPFPGPAALPPCVGAALLIAAGPQTQVAQMLSLRPVVFVGLASYSLYLWHWPLLSFAEYYTIAPLTGFQTAFVLAVSFAISVLSLKFIERPFRTSGVFSRTQVFAAGGAGLVTAIALGVALQETDGVPQRFSPPVRALTDATALEYGVDMARCPSRRDSLTPEAREAIFVMFCQVGPEERPATTLLWGDSHALSVGAALQSAAEAAGEPLLVTSRAACAPLLEYEWRLTQTWRGCMAHNRAVIASLERLGITRVLMFGAWGAYANAAGDAPTPESEAAFRDAVRRTLAVLRDKGIEVIIGSSVPVHYPVAIPSALHRVQVLGSTLQVDLSRAAHEANQEPELTVLREEAADFGAAVFRLDDLFCDDERCRIEADGLPLYADHGHINLHAADRIAADLAPLLSAAP